MKVYVDIPYKLRGIGKSLVPNQLSTVTMRE